MAAKNVLKIDNREFAITNPEKVLYPAGKFTKADVVAYYLQVARWLLPHFRNRPVTLKRYPDGVFGEAFYEKDAPAFTPEWVKTFPVPRREGGSDINYILIDDRATLAWAANMAALELHPFLHRAPKIDTPTHVVFDLDPGEGTAVLECARVALLLRDLLGKLRLKSWPKVSGSKGIQVYVPLNTPVTYDGTQPFARAVAELLAEQHPDLIVAEMAKNLRRGKVFIDWSQNADHKTTVGVYSLRAKRGRPFASMPVKWSELTAALKTRKIDNLYFQAGGALTRLKKMGDLFAPVLKTKQHLPRKFAALQAAKRHGSAKSLEQYSAKRDFTKTSEPSPELPRRSAQGSRRRFVVQKHAASHLHYDLRLEMHDVLKSWAVPKGLSLKRGETRTAFETEDHPLEYLQFEGAIPQGEYGGGTVMVWDIGTYEVGVGNYWKGQLSIFLKGKKLNGGWSLRRVESENGKTKWLIDKIDRDAKPISAKRAELSVLTGRTMDEIAREQIWGAHAPSGAVSGASPETSANLKKPKSAARGAHRSSTRGRVRSPEFVPPMKATAVTKLPEGEQWIYEVKWDGYRALAAKAGDDVRLLSLKNRSLTPDFPTVVEAVRGVHADSALMDGEIVAIDPRGRPSFQMLQNRGSLGRGWAIVYYAFDLLEVDNVDFKSRPLAQRKAKLRAIVEATAVRYNGELSGSLPAILHTVKDAGLEGIVAKDRQSHYRAGTRVTTWLKLKLSKVQEFVIGGYKPNAGSLQSILAGYYENGDLIFAGKARQGFNPASRKRLLEAMRPLLTEKCPFANLPTSKKSHFGEGITQEEMTELCWLKPKLVAQISFTEWTNYGLLRHATFEGLRDDKDPREVRREIVG